MTTPKQQYDAMLDDLEPEEKVRLIDHVPFAKLPDFEPQCDICGESFVADDADAVAICQACALGEDEGDDEDEDEEEEE
jgi:formylmethanofuran dehydrogenase subunit E